LPRSTDTIARPAQLTKTPRSVDRFASGGDRRRDRGAGTAGLVRRANLRPGGGGLPPVAGCRDDHQRADHGGGPDRHRHQGNAHRRKVDVSQVVSSRVQQQNDFVIDVLEILYGGSAHGSNRSTKCVKLCCRLSSSSTLAPTRCCCCTGGGICGCIGGILECERCGGGADILGGTSALLNKVVCVG
jgi:hypothetical protein